MDYIRGTEPYTNFDPANYLWLPQYPELFANGDGMFIYPGVSGALSTVRLENIRDGLEDWELLLRLPPASRALIDAVAASPTEWTDDSALFDRVRRQVAEIVQTV